MTKDTKKTPTTRELVAARQQAAAPKQSVTTPEPADNREYRQRYLDEVAPASIVGRMVKFNKEGKFATTDDDSEISEHEEFVALCGESLVGWVRFNGEGEPPDRVMGLLYDGFQMPERESLGDLDQKQWEIGLDGQPADPWQHQMYLVLQNATTLEMLTFVTSSKTGRRSVGTLLHHYDRMHRTHPDELPVVQLRTGGFQHKDARVGFVSVPVFCVVGRRPADGVIKPDPSMSTLIDDAIPSFEE